MLENPKRPFVAILGGSKVSDKIKVIDALMDKCDTLIIGGGMCFTFLLAQGKSVGTSLKEEEWVERAQAMIATRRRPAACKLLLAGGRGGGRRASPNDARDGNGFGRRHSRRYDGPRHRSRDREALQPMRSPARHTVFWNGPMGVFEMPAFEAGTKAVAEAVADNQQADTIIGGGD